MKYVIIKSRGNEVAVVFSELIDHNRFAAMNPISAGFCDINGDTGSKSQELGVYLWGESVTLKLKTREEDSDIIKQTLTFSI